MYNRRQFLGAIGRPAAAAVSLAVLDPLKINNVLAALDMHTGSAQEIAEDESYWFKVQQAFTVDRSIINLNSGGVSPSPVVVQDAMKRYLDYSNTAPVYTMWRILEPQREGVRIRLARFFGCDPEEVALTRNASESLQICQLGFDLKAGDEVLTTNQDYPRMITTWQQRERRENIKLVQFSIPVPSEDDDKIVSLFEQRITPKTKLILMCHMINLTGQILPIIKVTQMAREKGIPVIVDGAHSLSHFPFTSKDLECDVFATSLHKWTYAPHGTGMLYVRKDMIKEFWPMMAAPEKMDDDIRKFEEIGTHPAANYLAIADALTFNQGLGLERKAERLRFLRNRWANRLIQHERVRLHTSLNPRFSCGIATVQIEGIDCGKLSNHLWKKYRIIVTPIKHAEFEGIRISPNVFTTLEEIDRFSEAMEIIVRKGIES
jgi:selenocysteine lyase/cysteine desulfurase